MSERAELAALLASAGIEADQAARLAIFGERLLETNRRFNLTGAATAQTLAPHILDSLSIQEYIVSPLVDVGSGGGLPGIPLAVVTGAETTFVEASTKKAAFLEAVVAVCGVHGRVVPERAEIAARHADLREAFASATVRAVAPAPAALELAMPFLRVGGTVVLQQGTLGDRERNAARDAAAMLGGSSPEEIPLSGGRRVLLVRKADSTPQRFPRRNGVPAKRPLCM